MRGTSQTLDVTNVNTFDTISSISSIRSVTGNIESYVNRHLTPCQCKSC